MRSPRNPLSSRRRRCVVVAAAALTGLPVLAGTASAGQIGLSPFKPAPAKAESHVITLITGDVVDYLQYPDGKAVASIRKAPGREHVQFKRLVDRDAQGRPRLAVIPSDAERALASGRLDRRLFDVTELARLGYDDAKRADIPLIVSHPQGIRAAAPPAGTRVTRELPSISGAALAADKKFANAWWLSVGTPQGLAPSVDRIWLDGKRQVLDDESNAQIGVPAARAAGYTGKGVTVAVLDTGIDAKHPDLAGKIGATQDFTGSEDGMTDDVGHGTHVSSIIAGSGAASNGKYAGVAPDAQLIEGKVCVESGCDESWIVAGMEWAVAQHATIASLSLGGFDTPGVDPLEQAVNTLSTSGTLFVVAAGNDGPYSGTLNSPASADAALAVASVSKQDVLSGFSSRGPRKGDYAVKPEIAAPGEAIIAARAAGTSMGTPVDANYTSASGTSMATPHVSGAAALLAQAHPGWTADQLKSGLASTAKPIAGVSVFGQGAGRLDAGRAVTQQVIANPTASFGAIAYPWASQPDQTRQVTYTNSGTSPVTLNLTGTITDKNGAAAPAGLFTLGASQVTVPAQGKASVSITLDTAALNGENVYSGRLTANTADGAVSVQTAFGTSAGPETHTLTVQYIDRNGNPASDALTHESSAYDLTLGGLLEPSALSGGKTVTLLPKGTYNYSAYIATPRADDPTAVASQTYVLTPRFELDKDVTLVIDARKGNPLTVRTDKKDPVRANVLWNPWVAPLDNGLWLSAEFGTDDPNIAVYAIPLTETADQLEFQPEVTLVAPETSAEKYRYELVFPSIGQIPAKLDYRVRNNQLATVDAVYKAQNVTDSWMLNVIAVFATPHAWVSFGVATISDLPLRETEYYSAAPGIIYQHFFRGISRKGGVPASAVGDRQASFTPGQRIQQDWNSSVLRPELDISQQYGAGGIFRYKDDIAAYAPIFAPSEAAHTVYDPGIELAWGTGTATLSSGADSATASQHLAAFSVPAEELPYTLHVSATRDVTWSKSATTVDAKWTFRSGHVTGFATLPLVSGRIRGAFDDYDQAPAGCRFPLQLVVKTVDGVPVSAITKVGLEYSTDDGVTWKTAPVGRKLDAQTWDASVQNPASGSVSLRLKATAANGNTLEQTVIRAYGVTAH